ncbi:DUF4112 domain-containing protein [Calycomorphotria hydatis]|nr:DUF4112 domain-containing protein [Calycomorphotria hydatis]
MATLSDNFTASRSDFFAKKSKSNQLSDRERSIKRIKALSHVLDDAFKIPGLGVRFGWDGLIGLIPGIGDVTTMGLSTIILIEAVRGGVPTWQIIKMLALIGLDACIGAIPILGDGFDFAFKANKKIARMALKHLEKDA